MAMLAEQGGGWKQSSPAAGVACVLLRNPAQSGPERRPRAPAGQQTRELRKHRLATHDRAVSVANQVHVVVNAPKEVAAHREESSSGAKNCSARCRPAPGRHVFQMNNAGSAAASLERRGRCCMVIPSARRPEMAQAQTSMANLVPARELAARNRIRLPNESEEYRRARNALLAEEIELRRHIERVAEMRRALPPGGEVKKQYRFEGEHGPVSFAELFGDKQTLLVYSYMYGPERLLPCPMCTSLLSAWDGEARDIEQNIALAVVAQSPIERLVAIKKERGWRHLKLYSDSSREYSDDYLANTPEYADSAAVNVFTRRDGVIRHFWAAEMGFEQADPGQDPRGAPDLMPLWTVLDCTPEGRRPDWYPSLEYGE
jgi:predicted dithiol-disulfide oxidoreductase (DUF899 family)